MACAPLDDLPPMFQSTVHHHQHATSDENRDKTVHFANSHARSSRMIARENSAASLELPSVGVLRRNWLLVHSNSAVADLIVRCMEEWPGVRATAVASLAPYAEKWRAMPTLLKEWDVVCG